MVQVDVFWSYAIGASFAAAASRQLKEEKKPFQNKYFTYTLAFLAMLFAPSGIYLLWRFPDWETMQVAVNHQSLPAWLVTAFAVTNITQGVLGFYVAWRFIRAGRFYEAHLQWFLGYFFMFFILLYGWDGTGWQRFLYDSSVNGGVHWAPGMHMGWAFLTSNVAMTLGVMGLVILPLKFIPMALWTVEGFKMESAGAPHWRFQRWEAVAAAYGVLVLVVGLGAAALAALLSHAGGLLVGGPGLGILLGLPAFALLAWALLFRENFPVHLAFSHLYVRQAQGD
ncbi:MAG: hypothetical protein JRI97_09010 [Deltaproteobacteria bacterium]|nr:hypothetical protein [Deltaproteobacteria bacterium]